MRAIGSHMNCQSINDFTPVFASLDHEHMYTKIFSDSLAAFCHNNIMRASKIVELAEASDMQELRVQISK